jgi:hypothetical protein
LSSPIAVLVFEISRKSLMETTARPPVWDWAFQALAG